MATLERISRYPVKGLSAESLPEIKLTSGRGVPNDRAFALALADTEFDEDNPRPIPKTKFAVLARFARLAELYTIFDVPTSTPSLRLADSTLAVGCISVRHGSPSIRVFVAVVFPEAIDRKRPTAGGHKSSNTITVIGIAYFHEGGRPHQGSLCFGGRRL
jgi:hypothetical protein